MPDGIVVTVMLDLGAPPPSENCVTLRLVEFPNFLCREF